MNYYLLAILVIASYLLGNISFGRIVSASRNVDITKQGSGNPGMTNVMRTHGAKLGVLVLVLDVLKGAIPALVGVFVFGGYTQSEIPLFLTGTAESYTALFACGFASMLGHIFPVFYKFKGGKGVATFVGIFFVAQPLLSLIVFAVAFLSLLLFKLMSVTSIGLIIVLTTLQLIYVPSGNNIAIYVILVLMLLLTIFSHRSNIVRLIKGTENITSIQEAIKKDKERVKQEHKDKKQEIKNDFKQNKKEYKDENITKQDLKQNKKEYKQKKDEIRQEKKTQLSEIKQDKKAQIKEVKQAKALSKSEQSSKNESDLKLTQNDNSQNDTANENN
ncbi:MAG: glycerol-3-phosphate 1-O-acyltransferase PlsY [Christensenellales bacterium]